MSLRTQADFKDEFDSALWREELAALLDRSQAHIIDADGTLADITTNFNILLAQLEALGILRDS